MLMMLMIAHLSQKIRYGKADLSDVKNNQRKFKTYPREIRKGNKSKKAIKGYTRLLNFMMIIL